MRLSTGLFAALITALTFNLAGTVEAKEANKEQKPKFATLHTSMGDIKMELFWDKAPKAVSNFVGLATGTKEYTDPKTRKPTKSKFYDGVIFHRVIDNFMIQTGDPLGNGMGGPGYEFENEDSDLTFDQPGRVGMANRGRNTNGSQFFITVAPTPHLNKGYTIWAQVVEGMDAVNKIAKARTGPMDRPIEQIEIKNVSFSEK